MTAQATERLIVTQPGVYDLTEQQYHGDPVPGGSLSSTGARRLLPPSCPARYRYDLDHPTPTTKALDLGTAAHSMVLGIGAPIVLVDAPDWRTKAAREAREAAHANGAVPLLPADYQQVQDMATALRQQPTAGALLDPDRGGSPERSLFWVDQPTTVWRRARLDWMPDPSAGRRPIIGDYKTCRDASPDALQKAIHTYGYHQQAAWYLDAGAELGLWDHDAAFVFICQEKTPPYLVTVVEPDPMALRIGRALNRRALELFRDCTLSGHWPGYADDVIQLGLPMWAENRFLEETQ